MRRVSCRKYMYVFCFCRFLIIDTCACKPLLVDFKQKLSQRLGHLLFGVSCAIQSLETCRDERFYQFETFCRLLNNTINTMVTSKAYSTDVSPRSPHKSQVD